MSINHNGVPSWFIAPSTGSNQKWTGCFLMFPLKRKKLAAISLNFSARWQIFQDYHFDLFLDYSFARGLLGYNENWIHSSRFEDLSSFRWAPLILLITFVIALPVGWGSVTYILVAELVPTQIRTETAVLCDAWGQLLQVTRKGYYPYTIANTCLLIHT